MYCCWEMSTAKDYCPERPWCHSRELTPAMTLCSGDRKVPKSECQLYENLYWDTILFRCRQLDGSHCQQGASQGNGFELRKCVNFCHDFPTADCHFTTGRVIGQLYSHQSSIRKQMLKKWLLGGRICAWYWFLQESGEHLFSLLQKIMK